MEMVCHNGRWVSRIEVNVPISNRAFRYGDSLFESFTIRKRNWIFFEDHFQRLIEGADLLSYKLPTDFKNRLQLAISNIPSTSVNGYGRLMLYRNGTGKYTPDDNTTSWLLEFTPSSNENYQALETGLKIDICSDVILQPSGLANYKTGNSLLYVIASQAKIQSGMDDMLLLGPANNIVESTNANIFLCKENKIYTPPLSQGCLAGILRKKLISMVRNEPQFELLEEPITIKELLNSDEIWLTNASNGIRWVQSFRNRNFVKNQYSFWLSKLNDLVKNQLKDINV